MKITKTILALVTMSLLSACSSSPDRRGPPPDQQTRGGGKVRTSGVFIKPIGLLFVSMDENKDAILSRPELGVGIAQEWSSFNGKTSAAYFSAWSQKSLGSTDARPTFLSFDADLNGVVTELEFADRLRREFSDMDKNSDNQLTRDEMLVIFEAPQAQQRRGSEERGRGGSGQRGEGGGGRPPR